MKSPNKTTLDCRGTCLVCFLVAGWVYTAPSRGHLSAQFDVWRGHHIVLAYGLPSPWRPASAQLLRERYGIEIHTVALCILSETLRSYADSYNEVSVAAANRKFGRFQGVRGSCKGSGASEGSSITQRMIP